MRVADAEPIDRTASRARVFRGFTPSGPTIMYTYVNGQVDQIRVNGTTVLSGVIYEPFGPLRQWTWGNGTLAVRNYDQDGNVEQIDSAGLNSFAHDDAFRITAITDADNSALSH